MRENISRPTCWFHPHWFHPHFSNLSRRLPFKSPRQDRHSCTALPDSNRVAGFWQFRYPAKADLKPRQRFQVLVDDRGVSVTVPFQTPSIPDTTAAKRTSGADVLQQTRLPSYISHPDTGHDSHRFSNGVDGTRQTQQSVHPGFQTTHDTRFKQDKYIHSFFLYEP